MSKKLNEIYFEDFRFSFPEQCLFRGDKVVALSGKECEILAALLEADSKVVPKELLWQKIWPEKQVEASNLYHHVKSLRGKLGPRKDGQPVIETIPGRGYRLLILAQSPEQELSQPSPVAAPANPSQQVDIAPPATHSHHSRKFLYTDPPWKWIVALASLATIIAGVSVLSSRQPPRAQTFSDSTLLTSLEAVPGLQLLKTIEVGALPSSALLLDERRELYVSDEGSAVSVIDTSRDVVVARFAVGRSPLQLRLTPDRKRIFIAQSSGVGVIDVASRSFRCASTARDPVDDIVMTPDGKSAYLAEGFRGLAKLDLATEKITVISKILFARALALTPDGRRLYVSYQAKGPGGSFGHDSIGYFDATTDQFAGAISGFPNVGECLTVSPDSSQVWENGADACDSPQYDHVGCPFVPGGLLNIVNVGSNKVRAVGVRGARLMCATFSPSGEFAAVGTTDHLMLIKVRDLTLMGSLPMGSSGRIAFTSDGLKAYVPINAKPQVAVIAFGVQVRTLHLTNRESEDGMVQVAIESGPDFDAKAIDPTSLRLAGVPAERGKDGSLAASIEHIDGSEGHSLIIKFDLERANTTAELQLVGKTFAGTPIRGTVNVF